jgi:hypothetical protein
MSTELDSSFNVFRYRYRAISYKCLINLPFLLGLVFGVGSEPDPDFGAI